MTRLVAMTVALLAISGTARAQGEDDPPKPEEETVTTEEPPPPPPPDEAEKPAKKAAASVEAGGFEEVGAPKARLTLPGGKFMLTAVVEANMAKDLIGKPLSIAPDLWIGAHDKLTFGIVHSGRAATGFLTGFGTGICLRGQGFCDAGLGKAYTFGGAEARIGLLEGGFALAFVGGLHAGPFEPELFLTGKAGFIARMGSDRIALELAPAAYIGVTQRDFNVDRFGAPVTIYLRLAGQFALALQGGVTFVFKDIGNSWQIPAAAGIAWWVTPHFSFDAAFGLAAVADSDDATKAFDNRSVTVGIGYAL